MDIPRRLVIQKQPFHQEEADQKTIDESDTATDFQVISHEIATEMSLFAA